MVPIQCVTMSAISFLRSSFGLIPYFLLYITIRVGSTLFLSLLLILVHPISCSFCFFLIKCSLFCLFDAFPYIYIFSINLFRNFLSVIDVVVFEIGSLVLKLGNSQSFSGSISFSQRFTGVSIFACLAKKKSLRELNSLVFSKKTGV